MMTSKEIATELGVNHNTLRRRLVSWGIQVTKKANGNYVVNYYTKAGVAKIKALLEADPIGKRGRPLKNPKVALKKKSGIKKRRNRG